MAAIIGRDDNLEQAMTKINQEIGSRRTYGVRREVLPTTKRATVCDWSNASAAWFCGNLQTELVCQKGSAELRQVVDAFNAWRATCRWPDWNEHNAQYEKVENLSKQEGVRCQRRASPSQCLDANEIAITGIDRKKADLLSKTFAPLPLYAGSFEARRRGVFSLLGIEVPPGISQQRMDDLDIQTIRALVMKSAEKYEEEE